MLLVQDVEVVQASLPVKALLYIVYLRISRYLFMMPALLKLIIGRAAAPALMASTLLSAYDMPLWRTEYCRQKSAAACGIKLK